MTSTAPALISGVKKHRSAWPMECPSTLTPVGVPRTWDPWCGFSTSPSLNPPRTLAGTQIGEWTHKSPICVPFSGAVLDEDRHRIVDTFSLSTERCKKVRGQRSKDGKEGPYQDRPPLCPFRLLPLLIYSGSTIAFLKILKVQGPKSKNIENVILLQP